MRRRTTNQSNLRVYQKPNFCVGLRFLVQALYWLVWKILSWLCRLHPEHCRKWLWVCPFYWLWALYPKPLRAYF